MLRWLTRRSALLDALWATVAAAATLTLWLSGAFRSQELRLLDRRYQTTPAPAAGGDVVLVTIDDTSLQFLGRWPWPRSTHAELIDRLTKAGAKVIALDVVFAEPSDPAEDGALEQALKRSGRVILPVFLPPSERQGGIERSMALYPVRALEKAAAVIGHIGLSADGDGRFRRVRLYVKDPVRDVALPAFSLAAVCRYLDAPLPPVSSVAKRRIDLGGGRAIYTDGQGRFLCNYFSDPESLHKGRGIREVKYVEVLYGNLPADVFRDKLVIVGATARGIGEQFFNTPAPQGTPLSGAEVHASAAETLLHNACVRKPAPQRYGTALFLASLLFAFAMLRWRVYDALYSVLAVGLFLGGVWMFAQRQFHAAYEWIEYYPFVAVAVGALVVQVLWRLADALYLVLRRRTELDLITEVGARASSASELSDDFHAALEAALAVADTKVGALWALDEKEEGFCLELVSGLPPDAVTVDSFQAGDGVLGELVASGAHVAVRDAKHSEGDDLSLWRSAYSSLALLPLRARGRSVGLLAVGKLGSQSFEPEQLQSLRAIASQSGLDLDNARLVQKIQRMFVATLGALIKALEAKDAYTRGHSDRVTEYAVLLGRQHGLDADALETLHHAGAMHDIGKIGMPDIVLNKPGKLTDEEYEAFKSHAKLTGDILEGLDWLHDVRDIAMHHHERWDGNGYPDKLQGEAIPLGARILSVADAYDAMTSDRPYRKGMPHEKAVGIIVEVAGSQLDPNLVESFLRVPDAPWTEAAQAVLRERDRAGEGTAAETQR